jgi:hypothetical protein
MHYQLFLPGRRHFATNIDLPAVGLEGLERPGDHRPKLKFGPGPDGRRGLFLGWTPNEAPGYWPQRQSWYPAKRDEQKGLPAGRFWIGFDDRSPMTPDELQRDERAFEGGTPCQVGGQTWIVPTVRWITFRLRLGPGDPHLWRAIDALNAMTEAHGAGEWELISAASLQLCLALLALNYRVMGGVCAKLGLFEPESVAAIDAAAITAPRIQDPRSHAAGCTPSALE